MPENTISCPWRKSNGPDAYLDIRAASPRRMGYVALHPIPSIIPLPKSADWGRVKVDTLRLPLREHRCSLIRFAGLGAVCRPCPFAGLCGEGLEFYAGDFGSV